MGQYMVPELFERFLGKQDETTLIDYLGSPKFLQASTNTSRLVNKLKVAVEAKELYETQQIIRTIYFRFINNSEKVEALIDLLYYGSIHLIDQKEHISGQDIGLLFLEASAKLLQARIDSLDDESQRSIVQFDVRYHIDRNTLDADICRKLSSIALRLPDTEIGQSKFIADALRLLPPRILNRDLLHEILANRFCEARDYTHARYHFLHSSCVADRVLVFMLIDLQTRLGSKSEVDLFIAQFILQYLCIQHPTDSPTIPGQPRHQRNSVTPAHLAVSKKSREVIAYTVRNLLIEYIGYNTHPDLGSDSRPYKLPLLNFIYLLISILAESRRSEAETFMLLVDTYEKAWSRDPNYQSYLNRIGVLYFGLADPTKQQQQQAGGGGFFNNILMSLLDAADEDEEEEEEVSRAQSREMFSYDELD